MMKTVLLITLLLVLYGCASQSSIESMSRSMSRQYDLATYTANDLNNADFQLKAAFVYTVLYNTTEVWTHRMNGEHGNEVFVHESGAEIVFDQNKQRVDSCENRGSFNYAHYQRQPLAHFTVDSLPWLKWGNCREDSTTTEQRLEAYLEDFEIGLRQTAAQDMTLFLPAEFDLTNPGDSEALSFYFNAFDVAEYDLKAFINGPQVTDKSVEDLLRHLKLGFMALLS